MCIKAACCAGSITFNADMDAKNGAPVYSLHPPIVPILPACPL